MAKIIGIDYDNGEMLAVYVETVEGRQKFVKERHGQWIPVTERLPGKGGTYIVTTAKGTVTTALFYEARTFPAQKWRDAYDRPARWQLNRKVTHWMPLPELPEDERRC